LNGFWNTEWENNHSRNLIFETDLIYLTFSKVHTLEINFCEMRTLECSTGGWRTYLLTRQQDSNCPIDRWHLISRLPEVDEMPMLRQDEMHGQMRPGVQWQIELGMRHWLREIVASM
jgi:hypothetical protein